MLHLPSYTNRTLFSDEYADIGFTGYPNYPHRVIDTPGGLLILEGMVYNHDPASLLTILSGIADAFQPSASLPSEGLKHFLLNADGEFILTLYDKAHRRLLIANDMLGRLPLYYHLDGSRFVFARELKFIVPFLSDLSFNKTGIMEYLLYGYPFEEHTFLQGVGFFPPGSICCYDIPSGKAVRKSYFNLNLEKPPIRARRTEIVSQMRKLFLDALTVRLRSTGYDKVIVSLSGGLDSRATLAGLRHQGCRPTAVTAQGTEEGLSRQVADVLGVETYAIPQGQADSRRNFDDTVFLKDGLDCHPNLTQLNDNLENLRGRFGEDAMYYTGIYGGEITRHSHPTGGLRNLGALVRYLLTAKDSGKCPTDTVAGLLHVPPARMATRLSRRLRSFPEKSVYKKYLRFRHECDMRFAGEAEDRNRFYCWTISPYLSPAFFHYVMSIDENRKNTRLFRDFLFALDANTCKVRYFNYRLSLRNTLLLRSLSLVERAARNRLIKNGFRRILLLLKACKRFVLKSRLWEAAELATHREELFELMRRPTAAGRFFNHPGLTAGIHHATDEQSLYRLRIVWSYLNNVELWRQSF